MRVVITIATFLPAKTTGPIRHVGTLARGLAEAGHDVTLLTSDRGYEGAAPADETWHGVRVRRLPARAESGHNVWSPGLARAILDAKPHVVHSQGYRNLFTHVAEAAARRAGIPHVLTTRGSYLGYTFLDEARHHGWPNRLYDLVTRKRALVRSHVVVTSLAERDEVLSSGIPPARVHLVPHGVDVRKFPTRPSAPKPGGKRLLFVGRLTDQRNLKMLLRGFARAVAEDPELRLTILGDAIPSRHHGSERRYMEEVLALHRELKLEERAVFAGGLYGDDLWRAYQESDVFAYPARYDNFGHALFEAAYFGLPIVGTPVGIARDLVASGAAGRIVPHDDDAAFAAGLLEASRGALATGRVADLSAYALERNIEDHERLYASLQEAA